VCTMKQLIAWLSMAALPLALHAQTVAPIAEQSAQFTQAPALLLAHSYRKGIPLAGYWVSEKYDGVRGY